MGISVKFLTCGIFFFFKCDLVTYLQTDITDKDRQTDGQSNS